MKGSVINKFIENAVEKIKKLARENTDLFLGIGGWLAPIGAVVIAVIVYCVNWAAYCYEVGYYHFGFNVPIGNTMCRCLGTDRGYFFLGCQSIIIKEFISGYAKKRSNSRYECDIRQRCAGFPLADCLKANTKKLG